MKAMRHLALVPLIVLATSLASTADIIDDANMFDPATLKEAEAKLERTEKLTHIPVRIETIESLRGADMTETAQRKAQRWDKPGLFVLIDKNEHKIQARDFHGIVGDRGDREIRNAFIDSFKKNDYNGGLIKGVDMIGDVLATAVPPSRRVGRQQAGGQFPPGRPQQQRRSGFPWWLTALLILAVLWIGMRVLGSLFGGGNRMGQPMGGPGGYPQGGGPGYGGYGGGYGGRGGGFMSSLFGGIGGAMAGNWLYDQFSGRHHGSSGMYPDQTNYDPGVNPADDPATGTWGGAETGDWGGGGGGDGGGGDWGGGGGGDWGGGDGGGGGDW